MHSQWHAKVNHEGVTIMLQVDDTPQWDKVSSFGQQADC